MKNFARKHEKRERNHEEDKGMTLITGHECKMCDTFGDFWIVKESKAVETWVCQSCGSRYTHDTNVY